MVVTLINNLILNIIIYMLIKDNIVQNISRVITIKKRISNQSEAQDKNNMIIQETIITAISDRINSTNLH